MWKIIVVILVFCWSVFQVSALDNRVENIYDSFINKIETNYSDEQVMEILKSVNERTKDLIYTTDNNLNYANALKDLQVLNNNKQYDVWLKDNLTNNSQLIRELQERKKLVSLLEDIQPNSISKELLSQNNIDFIATNEDGEFMKDNGIYKIQYSTYFPVNNDNLRALKSKSWIIIKFSENIYRFIEEYEVTKKIPYSNITELVSTIVTSKHRSIVDGDIITSYDFSSYKYFPDNYGIYKADLEKSWLDVNNTIVYLDDEGRYNFISEYKTHSFSWINDFSNATDLHTMYQYIAEDSKYPSANMYWQLTEIKNVAEALRKQSGNDQEYISAVYNWVLENIEYTQNININDEEIFSGLETFENKQWVCTWYSKLTAYLLLFGWISDSEMIKWHVIDAADFPEIWHAWVRIGESYYDPTFDDPVGLNVTKQPDEYKYFWLPRDIFYANRFEYADLPEWFDGLSDDNIDTYIYDNLLELSKKYSWEVSKYRVFSPIIFRNTYSIPEKTVITPSLLASKIWSYEVKNNSFSFMENNKKRTIKNFNYYSLDDSNTEDILSILNYDIDSLYLFDWELDSGERTWRLAYDITFR